MACCRYLEKLNTLDEFTALVDLFKPIFHTLALIWKHSKYYNSAARFVTLVQEMCNDLIMQVGRWVGQLAGEQCSAGGRGWRGVG